MQRAGDLRIVAMDDAVQLDGLVDPGVLLRGVILDDVAAEVEGEDVVGMQGGERGTEAVHQHAVGGDGHADVSGVGDAHALAVENPRGTADVELDLVEVDLRLTYKQVTGKEGEARF